ncbi:hypothetical protein JAAARDRAFT_33684 [Jaapia argillacea MUCL 33604]|uniref:DUF1692-domain-containing protein n=1 Tax=Jaapia argillacea MUCL 33604 TaxID=933084 RepID=A0A067PVX5_9AGAM|nr:hypothetical protein JAAARDRAFT_33684 [Jaapia argillacea MUCL 33604]
MSTTPTSDSDASDSILDKLDSIAPAPFKTFDAFPKLPSSYKERSESRGFLTLVVAFVAFLLVLNDIGEYIWGWPDYEFSVDRDKGSFMSVNVDMVINMPCGFLSVDLRDALGDRLYLSGAIQRDGTKFDIGQATALKTHQEALSARQAVSQSRNSRGIFDILFMRGSKPSFRPTYNYQSDGSACRVFGSLEVKKVTANLHITTLGHGYASHQHVDHKYMNLSHVITEFSFGPYFPDIAQPLDYSFEIAEAPFVAYQYFLHVVPTTYIAPRSSPLQTNQYSVTHYTRVLVPDRGTPGIFFKFDLDPMALSIHQRTTTLLQLLIRCVGVIGGIFVCSGYALRLTTRTLSTLTGSDSTPNIIAPESSSTSLKKKWGGGSLRSRNTSMGKVVRQGNSWVVEGGSPYTSYAGTPVSAGGFGPVVPPTPGSVYVTSPPPFGNSPYGGSAPPSANLGNGFSDVSAPHSPAPYSPAPPAGNFGLGLGPTSPPPPPPSSSFRNSIHGVPPPSPGSMYVNFPPTPNPVNGGGFPGSPGVGNGNGNGNGQGFAGMQRFGGAPAPAPKKDD